MPNQNGGGKRGPDTLPEIDFRLIEPVSKEGIQAPEIREIQGSVVEPTLTPDLADEAFESGDWFKSEAPGPDLEGSGLVVLNQDALAPEEVSDGSGSVEEGLGPWSSVQLDSMNPTSEAPAEVTASYGSPDPLYDAASTELSLPLRAPAEPTVPYFQEPSQTEGELPPVRQEEITDVEGVNSVLGGQMPMEKEDIEEGHIERVIMKLLEINNFADFERKEEFLNRLMRNLRTIIRSMSLLRNNNPSAFKIEIEGTEDLITREFFQLLSKVDLSDIREKLVEADLELAKRAISEMTETADAQKTVQAAIQRLLATLRP